MSWDGISRHAWQRNSPLSPVRSVRGRSSKPQLRCSQHARLNTALPRPPLQGLRPPLSTLQRGIPRAPAATHLPAFGSSCP